MLCSLLYLSMLPILTFQVKVPSPNGIICNVEMFRTSTENVVGHFFCVPTAQCRESAHRFPVVPFDACNSYFYDAGGDSLKCCHQSDITNGILHIWAENNSYLPGLRSYLMCKNNTHTLCGYNNRNLCYKDNLDSKKYKGIPTAIGKYPHTALIGYRNYEDKWNWFCMGSIINTRHILTSTYCLKDFVKVSTHVKVGESMICSECPDELEEQTLEIERHEIASGHTLQDIALIVVKEDIVYNKNVRPACLAARQPTRQSQGWFARYGKPESLVKTKKRQFPVFFLPKDNNLITFKVKASQDVHILLSKTGKPYARSQFLKVILGMNSNTKSGVIIRNYKAEVDSPDILQDQEFRGFWIRYQNWHILVGRENQTTPFLEADDPEPFQPLVVGISTPTGTGEWIFADHEALFSLHDLELEVLYAEDCKEHYPNITTTDTYEKISGNQNYVDDIVFCAGDIQTGKGPCDHDWGGSIQVVDDGFYCMWQIFGVYGVNAMNYPRNCSAQNPPAIFTNMANLIAWAEHHAFQEFSFETINIEPTSCSFPQDFKGQPGRC